MAPLLRCRPAARGEAEAEADEKDAAEAPRPSSSLSTPLRLRLLPDKLAPDTDGATVDASGPELRYMACERKLPRPPLPLLSTDRRVEPRERATPESRGEPELDALLPRRLLLLLWKGKRRPALWERRSTSDGAAALRLCTAVRDEARRAGCTAERLRDVEADPPLVSL